MKNGSFTITFGILLSLALVRPCALGADAVNSEPSVNIAKAASKASDPRLDGGSSAQTQRAYGPRITYTSVNLSKPYVALTFDDGPHATLTPRLLDILKKEGVKATFFILGQNVAEYPDIARRIVAEGHEIANHSWSHPVLAKMSDAAVESQLRRTSDIVRKTTGVEMPLMRPPYGAMSVRQRAWAKEKLGLKCILWSVDPLDWKVRNAASVRAKLVSGAHPGAILLVHDIHATTVNAMPATIADLKEKGYRFATVSDLIEMEEIPAPAATVVSKEPVAPDAR